MDSYVYTSIYSAICGFSQWPVVVALGQQLLVFVKDYVIGAWSA
jgi:hypothetical protein